mgnify:CR=1 FL=1
MNEGIADAETIDTVVKYSLGRRWNLVGPVASADLGGLDTFYNVSTYLLKDMDNGTEPSPLLEARVQAGDLGAKTGRGFYEWTGETGQAVIRQRDENLIRQLVEVVGGETDRAFHEYFRPPIGLRGPERGGKRIDLPFCRTYIRTA